MNGTIYDEIKKKEDTKKKEKLKFLVALISTNALVASLCLSLGTKTLPAISPKVPLLLHPRHKMIITPLSVLVERSQGSLETPVTLVNKDKKILITRAYLHEEINGRFKIEIPEEDVLNLSADTHELMIAIPQVVMKPKIKKPTNQRVSPYEVSL